MYLEGFIAGAEWQQSQDDWVETMDDVPPSGTMVDGYHPEWVDEDFNPEGIRECFWLDDELLPNNGWYSAKWNNYQDCWDVDEEYIPTHWKRRYSPQPPKP